MITSWFGTSTVGRLEVLVEKASFRRGGDQEFNVDMPLIGVRKTKGRGEEAEGIVVFTDHNIGAPENPWKDLRGWCNGFREVWG